MGGWIEGRLPQSSVSNQGGVEAGGVWGPQRLPGQSCLLGTHILSFEPEQCEGRYRHKAGGMSQHGVCRLFSTCMVEMGTGSSQVPVGEQRPKALALGHRPLC